MTSNTKVNARFSVLHENLKKALSIVTKVVENKPPLPVLANILLEAEGSRLRVVATDLRTSVIMWIGCKVDVSGTITLPAKTFNELVGKLSPERIDFTIDDDTHTANIKCGATNASIKGITADEYPPVNEFDGEPVELAFDIEGYQLKNLIKIAGHAAATENNRPILTGICFHMMPHKIEAVGADGYRLAYHSEEVETGIVMIPDADGNFTQGDKYFVIPADALKTMAKMIEDGDMVRVIFPQNRDLVQFLFPNITFTIQLLEGKYPAFDAIIPKAFSTEATVYTDDLKTMSIRADVFAKDSAHSGRFYIQPANSPNAPGQIQVVGKSAERGEMEAIMDAAIHGDAVDISSNIVYIQEAASMIDEERTIMKLNGNTSPVALVPEGRDNTLILIMPMAR